MKLGLIGPGRHGSRYLLEPNGGRYFTRVLSRHPRTDLPIWVKGTTDPEEFFAPGIEGVVIATPTETHFEFALEALERKLHVLCEKPLCNTWQDASILIDLAEARGLRLLVAHTDLFHASWIEHDDTMIVSDFRGEGSLSEWAPHAIATAIYASDIEPESWMWSKDRTRCSMSDRHGNRAHAIIRNGSPRRLVCSSEDMVFDGRSPSVPSPMLCMLDVFAGNDAKDERMSYDFTRAVYRVLLQGNADA